MSERFLVVEQVAALLHCSKRTVQAQVARSGLRKDGERGSRPYVLPAFFLRAPYEAPARESRPSGKPRCRQPGARTFPRASVIPWKPPSTQRTFG